MAIYWLDGFEQYGEDVDVQRAYSFAGAGLTSAQARTGSQSVYQASSTSPALRMNKDNEFSSGLTELYFGYAMYTTTNLATTAIIKYQNSVGSNHCQIYRMSSGALAIYDSGGTNRGQSLAGLISQNSWSYVEVYFKLGNAGVGAVTIRVDGSVVASDSSAGDYLNGTDSDIYQMGVNYANAYFYIDDLYLADHFLGPVKIKTFYPTSDGTYTDYTRNTGSNDYETVDDPSGPDDDTTYIESTQLGDQSTFGFTVSGIVGPIKGAALVNCIKKEGTLTAKAKGLARVNGSDYYDDIGREILCAEYYAHEQIVFEDNPDDSSIWTTTSLNNAEFGVETTVISTTTTTT